MVRLAMGFCGMCIEQALVMLAGAEVPYRT